MASQEEKVEGEQTETTAADDKAEFSGAWDELEAAETGQSAAAAERQEEADKGEAQGGDEAGQGEAQAGQPAATSPEADAEQASREKPSDDVWKDADPKLREAHENALREAQERASRAENQARSNGGRLAKALNELGALQQQIATKAGAEGSEATDEEIERLREEYPEVAGPLLKRLEKLTGTVDALTSSATARAEAEVGDALAGEFETLQGLHSDVGEIIKAPEYAEWLKGQAPSIQRIVQENSKAVVSAADTALVFDKFKADTGFGKAREPTEAEKQAAERRQRQLDAGKTATGSQPGMRSDARTGDGSYTDSWDEFERKDKAKAGSRR
jgi:hypothetical protein